MDIWNWISKLQTDLADAGQAHNAQLIDDVSSTVCDFEIERADALLPEARALAKTLSNPWLEIYTGHWEMRNRLGARGEGETALGDVVRLFEFAHREQNSACPQSVCVTQDMAACLGNIDGPGTVADRLAVCDETLARIDPSWACYQCLSNEKTEALLDAQRLDDALANHHGALQALRDAGEDVSEGMNEVECRILLERGDAAGALQRIEALEAKIEGREWRNIQLPRTLLKARALALLGRDDEAWDLLPPLGEVAPAEQQKWLRAALPVLQRVPERNTWALGAALQRTLDNFASLGAHRRAVDVALDLITLALARDAIWSARRLLAQGRAAAAQLRQDCGASALLDTAERDITARAGQQSLPVPADQLLAWLREQGDSGQSRNPEHEVEWLLAALDQRPDDAELLDLAASALQAIGAHDEAIARMWQYVERHHADEQPVAYSLMGALLNANDEAGVERLANLFVDVPVTAEWCRINLAQHKGDWPRAEALSRSLLGHAPQLVGARRALADALMAQQRYAEAVPALQAVTEVLDEPKNVYWDLLTAASASQDWATVRDYAARLDMELDASADPAAPIDENWGWIIIRYVHDGRPLDYYAWRTGPVTARITENAFNDHPQHVQDHVVFNAELVYPAPEDDEERENFIATFRHAHTLEQGGYGRGWIVDGAHPGDEAWEALRDAFAARGWQVSAHSRGDYEVFDSEHYKELPGLIFSVALPAAADPRELDRALADATRTWPHPMCWLRLAEHVGSDDRPHHAVIERYQL